MRLKAAIKGTINGLPVEGYGEGFYENGIVHGHYHLEGEGLTKGGVIVASCTSIISFDMCICGDPLRGAVNLAWVFDGKPHKVKVVHVVHDENMNPVVYFDEYADVREVKGDVMEAYVTFKAYYKRPAEVREARGYAIWLRQVSDGLIEGVYSYWLKGEDGESYYSTSRREYFYKSSRKLPFDEVWVYRIFELKKVREPRLEDVEWHAEAYFIPASKAKLLQGVEA